MRELAAQTGMELIVSRNGVIERIRPQIESKILQVPEEKWRKKGFMEIKQKNKSVPFSQNDEKYNIN